MVQNYSYSCSYMCMCQGVTKFNCSLVVFVLLLQAQTYWTKWDKAGEICLWCVWVYRVSSNQCKCDLHILKLQCVNLYLLHIKSSQPLILILQSQYSGFRKFAVLEVAREDEFSPLKNGKGSPTDSPDTALRDLLNLHYNYIVKAGGKFEDSAE